MSEQDPLEGAPPDNLLADYAPVQGASDELYQPDGTLRPVWRGFMDGLGDIPPDDLARRFARGDQYLRDAGVFYRQYAADGSTERAWPFSHIPVLIGEAEWAEISEGLIQRADLLERVVQDLYGPASLVATGHLPAHLVAASRNWLRPLVGTRPQTGNHLHFLAFEIGRGPDGTWWVLGDRTQAPAGAGFALENRVATARVFPDLIQAANAQRLTGFFRAFRDQLNALRGPGGRVGILTPGIHTEAYFEHAYIARYLGFMLLEGEDLRVEDGRVMVRTVDGLKPLDVLWRRMDASFCDPLELDEQSAIGTPGLVGALRHGRLAMLNSLGSGILETRALLAFLPRICEALTGEPLKLPNIATWWCGQRAERAHVRANIERMMIGPALSTRPLFEGDRTTVLGEGFRKRAQRQIDAFLDADGHNLVGQEAVRLSTTPAMIDGRLQPRPTTIRMYLARTATGWQVMPGGYARIGRTEDPSALSLQRGGTVADVWVVGERTAPAPEPALETAFVRTRHAVLPSRAADNLFWLGRYVERAEGAMRLLRAFHVRLTETADPAQPLMQAIADHLVPFDIDPMDVTTNGLRATLGLAVASAGHVRDRFSVDGWQALNDLDRTANRLAREVGPGDETAQAMSRLLAMQAGFSGLVSDNMYRFTGWRFLSIGRALERAHAMAFILQRFADPAAPDGALDLAVELGDSVMIHRQRYTTRTDRETVIDLLALDALNPRAMLHALGEIRELVSLLPGHGEQGQLSALARAVLRLHTDLAVETPEDLTGDDLARMAGDIGTVSDLLTESYMR